MEMITCSQCGQTYDPSAPACPACGYTPRVFVCSQCGSIYGATEPRCSNCGTFTEDAPKIPASQDVMQAEYQKACERLARATNTRQLERLAYYFSLLSASYDISAHMMQINDLFETFSAAEKQEQDYLQLEAAIAAATDNASLEKLAVQLKHLGTYKEAPVLLEQVQQKILRNKYAAAEALRDKAKKAPAWEAAADAFAALGEFADAPQQVELCQEKAAAAAKSKKRKGRAVVITLISIVLVIALVLSSIFFFIPLIFYSVGQHQFEAGQYEQAEQSFRRAGDFRDAPAKADESVLAGHYANGLALIAEGKYEEGAQELQAAHGYQDAEAQILQTGIQLVSQGKYDVAVDVFEYSSDAKKDNYISYAKGMKAYAGKDYETAVTELTNAGQVEDAPAKLEDATYCYGMDCIAKGNFATAKEQFTKVKTYKDAADLVLLCEAEDALAQGHLNAAIAAYEKVPETLTVEGLDIPARKTTVAGLTGFAAMCGNWSSSDNYVETRHISNSFGSWDSWYYDSDDKIAGQSVKVVCILEADGTITVKGSVTFHRFTNYSYYSSSCKSSNTTVSFEVKGLTSVPSKITVDDNTTLTFSGGTYKVEYSKRDNVSSSYHNIYSSKVTYGTLTETY